MTRHEQVLNKIGKQDVYLLNAFEEWAMLIPKTGGGEYPAKFKGGKLYKIARTTKLATDTLLEANEISKEEFEKY